MKSKIIINNKKYSRAFTAGALMFSESILITDLYLKLNSWQEVIKEATTTNILKARKSSSSIRIVSEAVTRLRNLSDKQLILFQTTDKATKQQLLWYAICKTFPFIFDFAKDVLHDKYSKMETILSIEDINVYFTKQAGWHEDLEKKAESTKSKMKVVLLRMLREAELVDKNNKIIPTFFSSEFLSCMPKDHEWVFLFPTQVTQQENYQ